jgi:lipid-A-disaccharide synthase
MRYYLIAGEASGDLHGSNLLKGLRKTDKKAEFRYWGGDLMKQQGGTLVKHYREHNIMGFIEVLQNLKTIKKNFRFCKQDILQFKPDVLILIDYPGFNLRMAEFAHKNGIKVYYYISPKIWAWKESRIKKIKSYVDKMFIIFPFEKDFYKKHNYPAEFHGNPLIDAVEDYKENALPFNEFIKQNNLDSRPIIALLPGSRKQEIDRNLNVMFEIMDKFNDFQFVIAGARSIDPDYYTKFISVENVHFVYDKTYNLLNHSRAAIVTSGTATLETALFNVPQVVCYRANPLSYHIAKWFVKIPYISLVNLNLQKEVVKEYIQKEMSASNLKEELDRILGDEKYRSNMLSMYNELHHVLGGKGASERFAQAIYKSLN